MASYKKDLQKLRKLRADYTAMMMKGYPCRGVCDALLITITNLESFIAVSDMMAKYQVDKKKNLS